MQVSGKRYAQAVFEIARQENLFDEWSYSLKSIAEVLQNAELKKMLENPKLSFDTKRQLVARCLGDVIPSALNLVYLLVAKGRVEIAHLIEVEYKNLLDAYNGVERAKVITAVPLDEEIKDKVIEMFERISGYRIKAEFEVDPSIIGGMQVKIMDKLIDGSVKNKLAIFKKKLVGEE